MVLKYDQNFIIPFQKFHDMSPQVNGANHTTHFNINNSNNNTSNEDDFFNDTFDRPKAMSVGANYGQVNNLFWEC